MAFVDLDSVPGYHNIMITEATDIMMPYLESDGHYLLRPSGDNKDGVLCTICVTSGSKLLNWRVVMDPESKVFYVYKTKTFPTLQLLLNHYRHMPIDANLTTCLLTPVLARQQQQQHPTEDSSEDTHTTYYGVDVSTSNVMPGQHLNLPKLDTQRSDVGNGLFAPYNNPTCKEHALQQEIAVMRRNMAHLERERDDALVKRAVTNVEFETFKSGFEEERRGRIRAQDELEDLLSKKGVAKAHQKQIDKSRHSFKMELAMMEEKLKTESDTYKDVICHFKATVEKLVAEKEMYKKEQHAKGIDLMKLKKVIEKSEVKIEKSERKIASLTREIHALKEDKKFTSREIKMLKQRLENAMLTATGQELNKSKSKLVKQVEDNCSISSSLVSTSIESSLSKTQKLYLIERYSNQSLRSEIDTLKEQMAEFLDANKKLKGLIIPATLSRRDLEPTDEYQPIDEDQPHDAASEVLEFLSSHSSPKLSSYAPALAARESLNWLDSVDSRPPLMSDSGHGVNTASIRAGDAYPINSKRLCSSLSSLLEIIAPQGAKQHDGSYQDPFRAGGHVSSQQIIQDGVEPCKDRQEINGERSQRNGEEAKLMSSQDDSDKIE